MLARRNKVIFLSVLVNLKLIIFQSLTNTLCCSWPGDGLGVGQVVGQVAGQPVGQAVGQAVGNGS